MTSKPIASISRNKLNNCLKCPRNFQANSANQHKNSSYKTEDDRK